MGKRFIVIFAAVVGCLLCASGLAACKKSKPAAGDEPPSHTHSYSEIWSYDETHHWHAATCEHTDRFADRSRHDFQDRACTVCGAQKASEGLQFTLSSDRSYYSVTGIGKCEDTDVVIPSRYLNRPVRNLGDYAFAGCDFIENVTIPDSVTSLGDGVFADCSSLVNVAIPDGVTGIWSETFARCTALESVRIPASVRYIGENAFLNAASLRVHISDLAAWCGIEFAGITANPLFLWGMLYLNGEIVTDLVIPDGVTRIGNYAFFNYQALRSVTLAESVVNIGDGAFADCGCLERVTIPSGVSRIGGIAFRDCTSLKEVYIEDLAAWCEADLVGASANPLKYTQKWYVDGEMVTDLVIPNGVTRIGSYAFYGCDSLRSVTIPGSVTRIGESAFADCMRHRKVYIEDLASWCGIKFESEVSNPLYYGALMYLQDNRVTDLEIPDGVTEIRDYAFIGCGSFESVTIPDSVTSMGMSVFQHAQSIAEAKIGNGVASIGEGTFYGCRVLERVEIGKSVTGIGTRAFFECSLLTTVTIPEKVSYLGDEVFGRCYELTSLTYGGMRNQWEDMRKSYSWNIESGITEIHCSDGTIAV